MPEEREKPLHKAVIFIDINKEGVCRVAGYTGSKEEGDQNFIEATSTGRAERAKRNAHDIVDDAIDEMFAVYEQQQSQPEPAKPKGGRRR